MHGERGVLPTQVGNNGVLSVLMGARDFQHAWSAPSRAGAARRCSLAFA
jgi:hypothetical protein